MTRRTFFRTALGALAGVVAWPIVGKAKATATDGLSKLDAMNNLLLEYGKVVHPELLMSPESYMEFRNACMGTVKLRMVKNTTGIKVMPGRVLYFKTSGKQGGA